MSYWRKSWKRWLVWLLIVSLFSVVCVALSEWQFQRRNTKVAEIELVQKNYDSVPVLIENLFPLSSLSTKNKWIPVLITGHYLNDQALLVRNRPNNGQPGFEQVVPFKFDGGTLLVDRGWVPTGTSGNLPDLNPLPDEGQTTITVHLLPSEPSSNRDAPAGQLPDLNLAKAASATGLDFDQNWYGQLSGEPGQTLPRPSGKPSLDEGNHLSYALQWIVFALMAFAFLGYVIRKEWLGYRIQIGLAKPKPKRVSRSARDAEAEDSATKAK